MSPIFCPHGHSYEVNSQSENLFHQLKFFNTFIMEVSVVKVVIPSILKDRKNKNMMLKGNLSYSGVNPKKN